MSTSVVSRKKIVTDIIAILAAVAASVALPQIFHAVGAISGAGATVGSAFLPMHIPVILAGMLFGPAVGLTAGILSPVISFMISGMPAIAILPFMVIELGVYGLVSGFMNKVKVNNFLKLIVVQIAGRAARALAVVAAIYILGDTTLTLASISGFIVSGLFGIVLQWAFIPLCVERFKRSDNV